MRVINRLDGVRRRGLARWGARGAGAVRDLQTKAFLWLLWLVWLPFLIFPLTALFTAHLPPLRFGLTLSGATLFVALYLFVIWRNTLRMTARAGAAPDGWALIWLPLLALITLSVALTLGAGFAWEDTFIFTVAITAGRLPVKQVLLTVLVEIGLAIACGATLGADWLSAASGSVLMGAAATSVVCLLRAVSAQRELHAAREELAHLAVTAERLRIARDLHDLLGHSLSLIALKSELAARLAPVAAERAISEIRDIESVARKALQEVRETVSGYRQPTLASELEGAGEALAAAGIAYRYDDGLADGVVSDDVDTTDMANAAQDARAMPAAVDATLAWAVREGVTNVIRHSRAHQCVVRVGRDDERASVEIADDGVGITDGAVSSSGDGAIGVTGASGTTGNGLRGLAERVAELGGRVDTAACVAGQPFKRDGGLRLVVTLPIERGVSLGGATALRGDAATPVHVGQASAASAELEATRL